MRASGGQVMHDEPPSAARDTFLAVVLCLLVGGMGFTFLVVITGGFFFYVLAVVLVFGLFGYVHYLLWGRSLSRAADDPSATEEFPPDTDVGEWPLEEPPGPPRM